MEKKKVKKTTTKKVVKSAVSKKNANKKTKGFTLIEILAVIGLIGVILIVAIPSITGISRSIKKRQYEAKKTVLVSAAEVYAKKNSSQFIKTFGDTYMIHVQVRDLIYYGYTNVDTKSDENCKDPIGCVMNPETDDSLNDEYITIKKIKSTLQATWGISEIEVPTDEQLFQLTLIGNGATYGCGGTGMSRCGYCTGVTSCTAVVPTIIRDNYEKLGWGTAASSETAVLEQGAPILLNSLNNNSTYYAVTRKNIVVSYNSNGGTFSQESPLQGVCSYYNTNTSCSIPNDQKPTLSTNKLGYVPDEINMWNTKADGTGNSINLSAVSNNAVAYVKWNAEAYTLALSPGVGTYSSIPSGYTKVDSNYIRNYTIETDNFTLPNGPIKAGYIFAGWTGEGVTSPQKVLTISKGSVGNRNYTASMNACQKGYYALAGDESCTACSIGAYQDIIASSECNVCGEGKTSSSVGTPELSNCIDCPNSANVASWETPTWSPNEVANLCKIKTCDTWYELIDNVCVQMHPFAFNYTGKFRVTGDANTVERTGEYAFSELGDWEVYLLTPGVFKPYYTTSTDIFAVGGGGGGAGTGCQTNTYAGGGGGGGGYTTTKTDISLTQNTEYTVTIGAGGSGGHGDVDGSTGGTTAFGSLVTAIGGAGGKARKKTDGTTYGGVGGAGGSGGGAGKAQGGSYENGVAHGGSNGTAGSVGGCTSSSCNSATYSKTPKGGTGCGTNGGCKINNSTCTNTTAFCSGTGTAYAGGGGGGVGARSNACGSSGGTGGTTGGGNGAQVCYSGGYDATPNTGGGGGGAGDCKHKGTDGFTSANNYNVYDGGAGGSGIVIVRNKR